MHRLIWVLILLLVIGITVGGCDLIGDVFPPYGGDENVEGFTAQPQQSSNQTTLSENGTAEPTSIVLPHRLYLLKGTDPGSFQIWILDDDGVSTQQVTFETEDVTGFDVSPTDGSIAYVVSNHLYWVNAEGNDRKLLVKGSPIDENSEKYLFQEKISNPSWSPGGTRLAYAMNGIRILDFTTGDTTHLVENVVDADGDRLFPNELFTPYAWSPDGDRLLLSIAFLEGGTLGILDPSTGEITTLRWKGIMCCHPSWTPGGDSILVGSPYLGMINSGLWRIDARIGEVEELIPSTSEDGTLNFVGWPFQTADGLLLYFYNNMADFPEGVVPFLMVASEVDGVTNRTQLRRDMMDVLEVLWAPDGSFALVVQPLRGEHPWPPRGTVVLVPTDETPQIPLVSGGYYLRWGP
jgi:hypothetical protein